MKSKANEDKPRKRKRRTIEELISDLEEEKKALVERLKSKELKTSAAFKAALGVIKSLDKASAAAAEEGETELRHVLTETRDVLAPFLEEKGLRLPKARRPRGPRPKD